MTQSLAKIWVHIIFSTKNRQPFLMEQSLQKKVHQYIASTCRQLGCTDVVVGGIDNHVHILLVMSKAITFPILIQKIKSSSSKWIKSLCGYKQNLSRFQWQRGYGAFSVSHSNVSTIIKYIHKQAWHHKKYSFENELIMLFAKHNIIYDKQYLFDP